MGLVNRVDRELADPLAFRTGAGNQVHAYGWPPASATAAVSLPRGSLAGIEFDADGDAVLSGNGWHWVILRGRSRSPCRLAKDLIGRCPKRTQRFLIDGNSMAYRAFFALPDSWQPPTAARPTRFRSGINDGQVDLGLPARQIAVAWDAGMSGREVVYPEYKAQRPPKPDLLRQQWPHLLKWSKRSDTNVKVDGYEADDVIATLTKQASMVDIPVVVVTVGTATPTSW